jgi:ATP-binding cassette subfamily F protein 3
LLLISHDRDFLDAVVGQIIAIDLQRLSLTTGGYSDYERARAARLATQQSAYEAQQRQIAHLSSYIERFRAKATKARQVQSRLRMLDKMERVSVARGEQEIDFNFPQPEPPGRVVMELKDITKAYGSVNVFQGVSLKIDRGDRIALLGVNGSGKSTLVRILAGLEPFQSGQRIPGHNVSVSYFAQHQAEGLDGAKTVLETLQTLAPAESLTRLRSLLGLFLFPGDDVFKKVAVLSGGEKSRLALARMLLMEANFLILDEPTNHLDVASKAVLQQALDNFSGSYVIVSHDRDFLEPIITKIVDIKDGQLRVQPGTVGNYLEKLRTEQQEAVLLRDTAGQKVQKKSPFHREKLRKREEAEKRQERYQRLKPLQAARQNLEEEITRYEQRKEKLEAALADPRTYENEELARSINLEYREINSGIEALYAEWTQVHEEIEQIGTD